MIFVFGFFNLKDTNLDLSFLIMLQDNYFFYFYFAKNYFHHGYFQEITFYCIRITIIK